MRPYISLTNFNPHSHAGSDMQRSSASAVDGISIHTPTQGVTRVHIKRKLLHFYFNPHSHAGSDTALTVLIFSPSYFNPHSHAGSDLAKIFWVRQNNPISIHTPTQGVTDIPKEQEEKFMISIHTPTQGVTNKYIKIPYNIIKFQSTLPRRE